jgi:hypothetical protein
MFFMKPKIISWNVRGLDDNEKRMGIRGLLRSGQLILCVFKRQKWRLLLQRWFVVYGVVIMWIDCIWGRQGHQEVLC